MVGRPPGNLIKEYASHGPMQQFRFEKAVAFSCFRCDTDKKSKLITIYNSNWNKRLCNGCYGFLLSIHSVKFSDLSEDERVEGLAEILKGLVDENVINEQIKLLKIKENRVRHIDVSTQKFIASSEYISSKLSDDYSLDWSPVVIGLCKAFENELITKLVRPFRVYCKNLDLAEDLKDKDIGRVANYIHKSSHKDPELGVFGHFLQTALNSKSRRETSVLIKAFFEFMSEFHNSNWVLDSGGLLKSIQDISRGFRNKAAHIEELSDKDYLECKNLIIGSSGAIWNLSHAVKI